MTTFINQAKNSANWVNQTENSASFVNSSKVGIWDGGLLLWDDSSYNWGGDNDWINQIKN